MRIDRLLYFLRFAKTRSLAHSLIGEGHVRRNGQRVMRCSQPVETGDILTFPAGEHVRVVEIMALPCRRGPPAEAHLCYRALDPQAQSAIAACESDQNKGTTLP